MNFNDVKDLNLNKILKLTHNELVSLAQKIKQINNKTVDRLYYKYKKQLQELNIDYIRDRITNNTSDEKLVNYIQDAYTNLTIGGGGKLGAKELKQIEIENRTIADVDNYLYDALYKDFLSKGTDEQITVVKQIIGSDIAYKDNIFKGSRIERTNKIMKYLKDNNLISMAGDLLL